MREWEFGFSLGLYGSLLDRSIYNYYWKCYYILRESTSERTAYLLFLPLKVMFFLIMVGNNVWSIMLLFDYIRSYQSLDLIFPSLVFNIFSCYLPSYFSSCDGRKLFTVFKGLLVWLLINFDLWWSVCSILAVVPVRTFVILS